MQPTRNPNLTIPTVDAETRTLQLPWTGKEPAECPGYQAEGTLTSLPLPNLATCTREEVQAYFDNTWTLTEVLFQSLLTPEAFYSAPYHQLRHPMVFYYGHPPALYVNKLRVAGLIEGPLDADLEVLFETGVDEMSWDDMSKNELEWPRVEAVLDYRRQVYQLVSKVIAEHADLAEGHAPVTWEDPLWALFLGFEHERIHLETSSVLIRELPVHLVTRPAHWPADAPESAARRGALQPRVGEHYPANDLVAVRAGEARLGKPRDWPSFGWDNEYGSDLREVGEFEVSQHLISNGEFWAFVAEGGYHEQRFWSENGWAWRTFRNVKWPTFWVSDGPAGLHRYKLRTTFELVEMPWSWPAIVNYHEAKAYAAWRADREEQCYRLPTEGEEALLSQRLLQTLGSQDLVMQHDGAELAERGLNLNLAFGSEGPVDGFAGAAVEGVSDVYGNVWRWVEDDFHPLQGSEVHPVYDDFSTPCYDGEHTMILHGSFVSTGDEASAYARFHFRPHFFQHAGFRLVKGGEGESGAVRLHDDADGSKYEQGTVLAAYLELHYGTPEEAMPFPIARDATEFPRRCADLVLDAAREQGVELKRALDLGCGVGRASFELAREAAVVTGVDLSEAFVETCQHMQRQGELEYQAPIEGELKEERRARVDPAIERERVRFRRADAQALPPELVGFDAVLAANLIDRLPSPGACLRRMGGPRGLVRPGGILVVTSPYTWREEFTPREVWLGGLVRRGQELASFEGLQEILREDFELLRQEDLPFVIREHGRKFELVFAHASVWRRRPE